MTSEYHQPFVLPTQEVTQVERLRKFAQAHLNEEQIRSLAEFSWRVQNDMPPRQLIDKYPQMPRQALDVMWWSESTHPDGWGYIWHIYTYLMNSGKPAALLENLGLLPQLRERHHLRQVVEETLFSSIVKAMAIASLDVTLPQEQRTEEQINGVSLLSLS